jgi:hypothetical protein
MKRRRFCRTSVAAAVALSYHQEFASADDWRGHVALPGSEACENVRLLLNPRVNTYPAMVLQPAVPTAL